MNVTQLADALERFGAHEDDCEAQLKIGGVPAHPCTCGLWKAIDAAKLLANTPHPQHERIELLADYIATFTNVPERKKQIELILRGWYPPILFVEPSAWSHKR